MGENKKSEVVSTSANGAMIVKNPDGSVNSYTPNRDSSGNIVSYTVETVRTASGYSPISSSSSSASSSSASSSSASSSSPPPPTKEERIKQYEDELISKNYNPALATQINAYTRNTIGIDLYDAIYLGNVKKGDPLYDYAVKLIGQENVNNLPVKNSGTLGGGGLGGGGGSSLTTQPPTTSSPTLSPSPSKPVLPNEMAGVLLRKGNVIPTNQSGTSNVVSYPGVTPSPKQDLTTQQMLANLPSTVPTYQAYSNMSEAEKAKLIQKYFYSLPKEQREKYLIGTDVLILQFPTSSNGERIPVVISKRDLYNIVTTQREKSLTSQISEIENNKIPIISIEQFNFMSDEDKRKYLSLYVSSLNEETLQENLVNDNMQIYLKNERDERVPIVFNINSLSRRWNNTQNFTETIKTEKDLREGGEIKMPIQYTNEELNSISSQKFEKVLGLYFSTYNQKRLEEEINKAKNEGKNYLEIKTRDGTFSVPFEQAISYYSRSSNLEDYVGNYNKLVSAGIPIFSNALEQQYRSQLKYDINRNIKADILTLGKDSLDMTFNLLKTGAESYAVTSIAGFGLKSGISGLGAISSGASVGNVLKTTSSEVLNAVTTPTVTSIAKIFVRNNAINVASQIERGINVLTMGYAVVKDLTNSSNTNDLIYSYGKGRNEFVLDVGRYVTFDKSMSQNERDNITLGFTLFNLPYYTLQIANVRPTGTLTSKGIEALYRSIQVGAVGVTTYSEVSREYEKTKNLPHALAYGVGYASTSLGLGDMYLEGKTIDKAFSNTKIYRTKQESLSKMIEAKKIDPNVYFNYQSSIEPKHELNIYQPKPNSKEGVFFSQKINMFSKINDKLTTKPDNKQDFLTSKLTTKPDNKQDMKIEDKVPDINFKSKLDFKTPKPDDKTSMRPEDKIPSRPDDKLIDKPRTDNKTQKPDDKNKYEDPRYDNKIDYKIDYHLKGNSPPFPFPLFIFSSPSSGGNRGFKFKTSEKGGQFIYKPSLWAMMSGIKGKPQSAGGVGIRPIPIEPRQPPIQNIKITFSKFGKKILGKNKRR